MVGIRFGLKFSTFSCCFHSIANRDVDVSQFVLLLDTQHVFSRKKKLANLIPCRFLCYHHFNYAQAHAHTLKTHTLNFRFVRRFTTSWFCFQKIAGYSLFFFIFILFSSIVASVIVVVGGGVSEWASVCFIDSSSLVRWLHLERNRIKSFAAQRSMYKSRLNWQKQNETMIWLYFHHSYKTIQIESKREIVWVCVCMRCVHCTHTVYFSHHHHSVVLLFFRSSHAYFWRHLCIRVGKCHGIFFLGEYSNDSFEFIYAVFVRFELEFNATNWLSTVIIRKTLAKMS